MAFIQAAPAAKIPFWKKKRVPVITNMQMGMGKLGDYDGPASRLGDYGDASSPPTSAADYLRAFTDFSNQALQTYAQVSQNARIARAQANAPAPAPTPVQRVSNFSRNNTGTLLAIAGGLAAVLIIPRLMRR